MGSHSISSGNGETAVDLVIEGKAGGDIYEISSTGERYDWGTITVFKPGKAFTMTWHLGNHKNMGTLVTVTFSSDSNNETDVVLRHDNWEILGDGAQEKRNNYNDGWVKVFEENFSNACQV